MDIILASGSPYRKQILEKLPIDFGCYSPDIDESPQLNENPDTLVKRLSLAKAKHTASYYPETLIIGSDQVASINNTILGKPKTIANARKQLHVASGQTVTFHTGLCLYHASKHHYQLSVDHYRVTFRTLSDNQINDYLKHEHVLDCAGSIKCEGLGILLIAALHGKDPNTLMGLPLINLIDFLSNEADFIGFY